MDRASSVKLGRKYAHYGPLDRYSPPPAAGLCISVFALIKRGSRVLVGIPERNRRWASEWIPAWLSYSKRELDEAYAQKRLPSAYLREGEHPRECLRRVMIDQLRIDRFTTTSERVFSYWALSTDWYPGERHWDIVFVYFVGITRLPRKPPWWRVLGFADKKEMGVEDFGWESDLMKDLGILGKNRVR